MAPFVPDSCGLQRSHHDTNRKDASVNLRTSGFKALPLALLLVVAVGCGGGAQQEKQQQPSTSTDATNGTAGVHGSVALRGAGAFVVLAGSTVTNTGATALTGDLGVSPGTAVTGFPPGTVTGAIHAGDATAAGAMADLTTAYNDAAGRTQAPVAVEGNLGGRTLSPGLYKSSSSLEISSGDLTLEASGDPNAVFVIQVASTLTTTSGRAVILSGGAQASNVFWQVGSSATLGTTSVFKGAIMADQSITLNNGANLNGRALARIGAVTLNANSVVRP